MLLCLERHLLLPGNKFEVWVFNALKHCAGRLAEDATPLVASASSTAIPASASTAPAAQTMPAALRGFGFNDPYRNPELHAHPGWHSQTLWNCFRSESWENLLRNLFRWIRDEAAPGQHLFGIFCTTGSYRSVASQSIPWCWENLPRITTYKVLIASREISLGMVPQTRKQKTKKRSGG